MSESWSAAARLRVWIYSSVVLGLGCFAYLLSISYWHPSGHTLFVFRLANGLMASAAGCLLLWRYGLKKFSAEVVIAAAFLGAGLINLVHAIIAVVGYLSSEELSFFLAYSERLYLSVFLLFGYLSSLLINDLGRISKINLRGLIALSAVVLLFVLWLLFFESIGSDQFTYQLIINTGFILPAVLFFLSLIGYLKRDYQDFRLCEHTLILVLIIGVFSQLWAFYSVEEYKEYSTGRIEIFNAIGYALFFIGSIRFCRPYQSVEFVRKDNKEGNKLSLLNNENALRVNLWFLIVTNVCALVLISGSFYVKDYIGETRDKSNGYLSAQANSVAGKLDGHYHSVSEDVSYLGEILGVSYAGYDRHSGSDRFWNQDVQRILFGYLSKQKNGGKVYFFDKENRFAVGIEKNENGISKVNSNRFSQIKYQQLLGHLDGHGGGFYHSIGDEFFVGDSGVAVNKTNMIGSYVEVLDGHSSVIGLLVVERAVSAIFSSIRDDLQQGLVMFIFNGAGELLYQSSSIYRDEMIRACLAETVVSDKHVPVGLYRLAPAGWSDDHIDVCVAYSSPVNPIAKRVIYLITFVGMLVIFFSLVILYVFNEILVYPLQGVIGALTHYDLDAAGKATASDDEIGVLARTFTDFVEKIREHEFALFVSERRYKAVIDTMADGVITIDADGVITSVNPAAAKIFHYEVNDLLGKNVACLVGPPHQSRHDDYLRRYRLTGKHCVIGAVRELQGLRSDGEVFPIELAVTEMSFRGQSHFVGVLRDVSERKEAERILHAREDELLRSNKDLEQFAYIASHDLQEPLRKITAFGERLISNYGDLLESRGVDYIQRMRSAAMRMGQLIDDLLSYSRIGVGVDHFVPVDLQKIVAEVLLDLEVLIKEVDAKIIIDPLPSLRADASQMRQLFQNLLANAIKFRRTGVQPQIHVAVNVDGANRNLVLRVQDNGIGFEPQHAERIFAVFQRLHSRDAYPGTGVGLAICRKIAERHGGRLHAEAIPGQGACFIVTLPLRN